jgi:hypothetical protein
VLMPYTVFCPPAGASSTLYSWIQSPPWGLRLHSA